MDSKKEPLLKAQVKRNTNLTLERSRRIQPLREKKRKQKMGELWGDLRRSCLVT